jgi:acetyl esterase
MSRMFTAALVFGLLVVSIVRAQDRDQPRQQAQFQQLFSLRGVEFTEEQRGKVNDLRKQYAPKLVELQRLRNSIYTREQRQARQNAFQTARNAGKQGEELQAAVSKALKLTDEQKKKQASLQQEQNKLVQEIQTSIRGLLTAEQRRQVQRQANRSLRRSATKPTHPNVKYGPSDRNVMDVWLAKSDKPTPVLVSIHGGGFRGGNKGVDPSLLSGCLDAGISVVAITYRLSDEAIAPAQFLDSARAIQFVRHNAKEWDLDPKRIAATGGSAGAGISLWLGFHDDLAEADNDDPVLRQSTRLTCMSVYNGQTSYDPRFIRDLFPETDTYKHQALAQLYDVNLSELDNLPAEKYKLFEQVSSINHLTKDDVPAQLTYASKIDTPITNQGVGIHHPKFGHTLKQRMDKLGIECEVHTGIRRGSEQWTMLTLDFVKKHFGIE